MHLKVFFSPVAAFSFQCSQNPLHTVPAKAPGERHTNGNDYNNVNAIVVKPNNA